MLLKLIKYEFKATYVRFLQIMIGALILSFITAIVLASGSKAVNNSANYFLSGTYMLTFSTWIIGMVAASIVIFIMIINRFYKSVASDGGYLTYTLPTNTIHIVTSKLIVAMIYEIIAGIFLTLFIIMNMMVMTLSITNISMQEIYDSIELSGKLKELFLILPFSIIIFMAQGILAWYLATVIGMQMKKHKIWLMLGVAFGIYILMNIFGMLVNSSDFVNLLTNTSNSYGVDLGDNLIIFYINTLLKDTFLNLIIGVIEFLATWKIMEKRPNLT